MRNNTGLEAQQVQPLWADGTVRGAPADKRSRRITAEPNAWAWVIARAINDPGILFEALTDAWMLTADMVDGQIEVRSYRLR